MSARPFILSVDSGSREEPGLRYFGSLEAAIEAMSEYDDRWQRFAWITESRDGETIVHVRDGKKS